MRKCFNIKYRADKYWWIFTWKGTFVCFFRTWLGGGIKTQVYRGLLWKLIIIIVYSWSIVQEDIYISIMNQFKLEMFYLLMLRMVHQDCLDKELVQLLLDTKRIQAEEAISVQNQHQNMG